MVPTRRLAGLVFVATIVALVAGYVPSLRPALVAVDALLVALVSVDVLWLRGRRIDWHRRTAAIFSVGRPNLVTLHLRNRSGSPLRGTFADDPLEACVASGNPGAFELPAHGATVVRYEIVPSQRGRREFGAVSARYRSLLGLVARQERVALVEGVDVYPDVHAARAVEILRRQGRRDHRLGSVRARGGDTEFERLRPYQTGDELRRVDWRASARRDELTVRTYQAESNQNVVFAIDVGRTMRGRTGGLTAVDHALNAALLTADAALRAGDKAGLLVFDDEPRRFVPPRAGYEGGRRLTRAVYALEASLATADFGVALRYLHTQVKMRSLLVVLTNVLDARSASELSSAARSLRPKHLPVCVLLRETDVETLATKPAGTTEQLYVRAAAAEWLAWRDSLIQKLRRGGVIVLDVAPHELTAELVKSYLDVKARRLL